MKSSFLGFQLAPSLRYTEWWSTKGRGCWSVTITTTILWQVINWNCTTAREDAHRAGKGLLCNQSNTACTHKLIALSNMPKWTCQQIQNQIYIYVHFMWENRSILSKQPLQLVNCKVKFLGNTFCKTGLL